LLKFTNKMDHILLLIKKLLFKKLNENGDWGLGIGDWGLGIGPIPNPQSPLLE